MKNIFSKLVLVAFAVYSLSGVAIARECVTNVKRSSKAAAVQTKAAVCKRAQSTAELNVNNVRALINGYGNMWFDGAVAQYHIPKNGNTCPLYCAALWIGGTDVNDQLRLSALTFGSSGDDYWPGPLNVTTAATDITICNAYDKHFVITKAEVQQFMSMFDYSGTGDPIPVNFNDADVPDIIKNWPAEDKTGQCNYLAPFYDADHDGTYNYAKGDYPYYDFDNELCPRELKRQWGDDYTDHVKVTMEDSIGDVHGGILSDQVLKGDQTIWWVFNDMGNVHTESQGQPIGMEIRAQAFAFSTNDEINNMTFYSYEVINRSTYELRETYFSQWVDIDLGFAYDDFVGCDVKRGLGYGYNGDESDGPGSGSYSGIPPAVGIDFFQGPYMDPDGLDNPKIDIEKIKNGTNATLKSLLEHYKRADGTYDTIGLTDDADKFYPDGWYCKKDDHIGNCAINGVNFGNNIVDDERFGMRRFVYYNNGDNNAAKRDPAKATDYYNYLRGFWQDGKRMKYGGDGYGTGIDPKNIDCDFMFPGDSDPLHWGTNTVVPDVNPEDWTEVTSGSNVTPGDRRFMQSAGPFTLKPGAVNYITVGIPFAQATSGNAWSSVELLRQIDDVCQALFDNCFKVLDGPDAPTMYVQELNNEVILYLQYDNIESNNYGEKYSEVDPAIVSYYTDENGVQHDYSEDDRSYKFEGYQIYQLANEHVSVADIRDVTKARLVAQCDVENYYDSIIYNYNPVTGEYLGSQVNEAPSLPIGTLVNYTSNSTTGLLTGNVMVQGANEGIQHVFRITTDQFATGVNTNLVNDREYYYICVAYAHNRFKEYSQTDANSMDGQKEPYLAGRKNEKGGTITAITAIPHDPYSENGGTIAQAEFGMSPYITRQDGFGNGGNVLKLDDSCLVQLMGEPNQPGIGPGSFDNNVMSNPCIIETPRYEENYGPVNVRVIDPLSVKEGKYIIKFSGSENDSRWTISNADPTKPLWSTMNADGSTNDVYEAKSDFTIGRYNEQIFMNLGIAISIVNADAPASKLEILDPREYLSRFWGSSVKTNALLSSSMTFADPNQQWLSGVPDNDASPIYNWIRSGSQYSQGAEATFVDTNMDVSIMEPYLDEDYFKMRLESMRFAELPLDKGQVMEGVVSGLWAPYGLTSTQVIHPGFNFSYYIAPKSVVDSLNKATNYVPEYYKLKRNLMLNSSNKSLMLNDMSQLPSVRIVMTADTSKWTRCPVLEMCDDYTQSEGSARRFQMRAHKSVNKEGKTVDDLGIAADVADPSNPAYINEYGMGWFPGYAISIATGERLNIMFGEDSRYVQYNGRDMMWNPVSTMMDGTQNYVMGGRHFIYVMNSANLQFFNLPGNNTNVQSYKTPSYDAGRWAAKMLTSLDHLMKTKDMKLRVMNGVFVSEQDKPCVGVRDSAALLFASTAWVNMPLVAENYEINNPMTDIPCDVTVDIHVNMPYGQTLSHNETKVDAVNNDKPQYMFELTEDIVTLTNQAVGEGESFQSLKDSILSLISVVPNPYYSYSAYETASQLETKIRFINVPEGSTISIYTVDGTMVRQFKKVTPASTTYDWDLHNHNGLPIAGGMYLIHFEVPEIGSRVVKWFGTMRPVDLNSFQY